MQKWLKKIFSGTSKEGPVAAAPDERRDESPTGDEDIVECLTRGVAAQDNGDKEDLSSNVDEHDHTAQEI